MRVWFSELVEAAEERDEDPAFAEVSDMALVEAFSAQASVVAAETSRWLRMLAEIVRRRLWARDGAKGPAAWLSWKVSMGGSTAREHVRVALALADWPLVAERFAAGELSYSKVRAITRSDRPELEDLLLRFADHATGAELERIVAGFERSGASSDREDPWSARSCDHRIVDGGLLEIRLRVPVEAGLTAVNAIDRRADQLARELRRASAEAPAPDATATEPVPRPTRSALRADAALESFDALGDALPMDRSGASRHLIVIHTAAEGLVAPPVGLDHAVPTDVQGGPTVPAMSVRTLRRLACDAPAQLVLHDGDGEVSSVTERRPPTGRQRMLLLLRDRGCRFPGCPSRRGLHAHHIVHWADGGPTELENLVLLCGHHHRFLHEEDWRIVTDGRGAFRFAPPDAPILPPVECLPGADPGPFSFPNECDRYDPDDWYLWRRSPLQASTDGPPDYDACVAALADAIHRHRDPAVPSRAA